MTGLIGGPIRTVGHRLSRPIASSPSGELLAEGVRWLDDLSGLAPSGRGGSGPDGVPGGPGGVAPGVPRGVHRFRTHDEARRQQDEHLVERMAAVARQRSGSQAAEPAPAAADLAVADPVSRPASFEDLKTLFAAFARHRVEYILIGGYALLALGHYRATSDLDLLVPATAAAGERVRAALAEVPGFATLSEGLQPRWFDASGADADGAPGADTQAAVAAAVVRVAGPYVFDLITNANGETYESLRQYAALVDLDGVPVRAVSLAGLRRTRPPGLLAD